MRSVLSKDTFHILLLIEDKYRRNGVHSHEQDGLGIIFTIEIGIK